jgi:hypothetical protein
VSCPNALLRKRIVGVLEMARSTTTSLARGFMGNGVPRGDKEVEEDVKDDGEV